MSKKMLIDATHAEETRVVVLDEGRLDEFDVDTSTKKQIKGNIYLAKVVRVEPSLQAAFVEYGGNRHGFLAFGEIHPDYYQIPVADKEELKALMAQKAAEEKAAESDDEADLSDADLDDIRPKASFLRKYKIQEVIRQGQVMLVQVIKEERGNKGAALTTYLSLAGRFSVLMPNNGKGGGVSRKINNVKDRKALRTIVDKLPIPEGMSVIIRTAGQGKTKTEIKRDYDYLIKTWTQIRDLTLESLAPKLIHEEGDIIKRSLRDVFTPDIDEIWVEGEAIFKTTRNFMKMLMPAQAKKIKQYKGTVPLFQANQVEQQLEALHSNIVQLSSGGYLVIDQTEALVAVDVNSGRATKEHDIEETALRTNLETCDELARQLRLRDLAGLVVIDFIDMDEARNNAAVERRLKEALKRDRARIQVGKMSGFGLMEMSRQRLHSSFLESSYTPCPCCGGKGMVRSTESCAMHALHMLEEVGVRNQGNTIILTLPPAVALYVLNNKRAHLMDLEHRYEMTVRIISDSTLPKASDFRLERLRADGETATIQIQNFHPRRFEKQMPKESKPMREAAQKAAQDASLTEAEKERDGGDKPTSSDENAGESRSARRRKSRNQRRREWKRKQKQLAEEARLQARNGKPLPETPEKSASQTAAPTEAKASETVPPAQTALSTDVHETALQPVAEEHFTVVEQVALSDVEAVSSEKPAAPKAKKQPRRKTPRREVRASKEVETTSTEVEKTSATDSASTVLTEAVQASADAVPKSLRRKGPKATVDASMTALGEAVSSASLPSEKPSQPQTTPSVSAASVASPTSSAPSATEGEASTPKKSGWWNKLVP